MSKLIQMPKRVSNKINKKLNKARLTSVSIPDFLQKYIEIFEEIDVIVSFNDWPSNIVDNSSSHDTPIGKIGAWTQEEKADPNIPNTYRAFKGHLSGMIKNNSEYDSESIDAHRMFWHFGPLAQKWIHVRPGSTKKEDNVETFTFNECFMFIDDFPEIYLKLRKEIKLD